jgi:hypothetical protein
MKNYYPIFVEGLLMFAPKSCFVKDWPLFKAVVNGYTINLQNHTKAKQVFTTTDDDKMTVYK